MTFCRFFPVLLLFGTLLARNTEAQNVRLDPLATFGPHDDGSLRPGDRPWLTATNHQRGLAFNPVTGHILIADHNPGHESVNIIDANTGADIGSLDMGTLETDGNSSFLINLVGVAADGAIYVGNLSNQQFPAQYNLYRWADEAAPKQLVFKGDPSGSKTNVLNQRWGDTMDVRGSGLQTQILLGSRGSLVSILRPTDAAMTNFTPTPLPTPTPVGALGYGLAFGAGDTFYGTAGAQSGGPLYRLEFSLSGNTVDLLSTYSSAVFPGTITPLAVDALDGRLAGIGMVPGADIIRFYDISTASQDPTFVDRRFFTTTNDNPVFAGALAFGNGRLYALDAANGIIAFDIVASSNPVEPGIFNQPASRTVAPGSNVTFTVSADGTLPLSYQWRFNETNIVDATNSSLTLANVQLADAGNYSVVVSNNASAVPSSHAMLTVTSVPAVTLLTYAPFNYPTSGALAGQGDWVLVSGTSATVEAGSLDVEGLVASAHNRIFWRNASMSIRLPLNTNITSGSVYYSFAMRVDTLGANFTAAGVLAGFTTGTGASFGSKVDITNTLSGYRLGTSKAGSGSLVFAPGTYASGDTLFIVGRYTFNPGAGDDVATLWIHPDPATFGANTPPPFTLNTTGGTDLTQIDRFFFRAGGSTSSPDKLVADELRVGLSWAAVTPPAAAPRLNIRRRGTDAVISWPSSAAGYVLQSAPAIPTNSWSAVGEPVLPDGTNSTVTVNASSASRFFRLQR